MSKRAEALLENYFGRIPDDKDIVALAEYIYEQAEKDIITTIESRISEILGDAQPAPVLRAELQDIVKRIRENREEAKKEAELTIKDIELLHVILYAVKNNKQGVIFTFTRLSDEQYQEVLRGFNEKRKEK